ncbi:MAG: hypothetical protein Kapaf2KO_19050 [Candidatus Kapaibacteriales bacterium]
MEIITKVFNSSGIKLLPIKKVEEISKLVLNDAKSRFDIDKSHIEVNIVYLSDSEIHKMNREYLNHDYPTDVITFTIENEGDRLEGEIYIGAETAKRQASEYNVSTTDELMRLALHGCLHLLRLDDQTKEQKAKMTKEEDRYLELYKKGDQ